MKTLLSIFLGIMIGLGAVSPMARPYMTSDESNIRLYENVIAKVV